MALDVFAIFLGPVGLMAAGLLVGTGLLVWSAVLGPSARQVRAAPFLAGMLFAVFALIIVSAIESTVDFHGRAERKLLSGDQFWEIVPRYGRSPISPSSQCSSSSRCP